MQLTVSGQHIDITDALRDHVHRRMDRIERHNSDLQRVEVTLIVDGDRRRAEANASLRGGNAFVHAENSDMYAAVDELADKLDRQVRRHREKRTEHR
jgi:putative sigma-54 modulation protein